jgi:hypothetical protein
MDNVIGIKGGCALNGEWLNAETRELIRQAVDRAKREQLTREGTMPRKYEKRIRARNDQDNARRAELRREATIRGWAKMGLIECEDGWHLQCLDCGKRTHKFGCSQIRRHTKDCYRRELVRNGRADPERSIRTTS